jgi:D-3-phosphoglycerate dehydrogenase
VTDLGGPTTLPVLDPVGTVMLDLVEGIGPGPRPDAEVLDAWRTSCPRLPVWEQANDRGFIVQDGGLVPVSVAGRSICAGHRRSSRC